jgi:hypothetical protein
MWKQYFWVGSLAMSLVLIGGCQRRAPKAPPPVRGAGGGEAAAMTPSSAPAGLGGSVAKELSKEETEANAKWCVEACKWLADSTRGARKVTVWTDRETKPVELGADKKETLAGALAAVKPEMLFGPAVFDPRSGDERMGPIVPVPSMTVEAVDAQGRQIYQVVIFCMEEWGENYQGKAPMGHVSVWTRGKDVLFFTGGIEEIVALVRGVVSAEAQKGEE